MREYDIPYALILLIDKDEQAAREVFLIIDVVQHYLGQVIILGSQGSSPKLLNKAHNLLLREVVQLDIHQNIQADIPLSRRLVDYPPPAQKSTDVLLDLGGEEFTLLLVLQLLLLLVLLEQEGVLSLLLFKHFSK